MLYHKSEAGVFLSSAAISLVTSLMFSLLFLFFLINNEILYVFGDAQTASEYPIYNPQTIVNSESDAVHNKSKILQPDTIILDRPVILTNNNANIHNLHLSVFRNNVYIVSSDNSTGNYEIFFTKSTDGGNSFSKPINLSDNIGHSINPYTFVSGTHLYIVSSDNSTGNYEIFLTKSTDGGNSFSKPINLSDNTGLSDFPQLSVVHGNNVYVVWVDKTIGNYEIFFTKSTDGGNSFSKPINLSKDIGILSDFPEVYGKDSTGEIFVLWVDRIREYMARIVPLAKNDEIFLTTSTTNASSFNMPINLSNNTSVSTDPELAVAENNVYVAWYDESIPRTDEIFFLKGKDDGSSFRSIINLSNNSGFSHQPDVAACQNNVYVTWSDNLNMQKENYDIFLSKSTDSGLTFIKVNVSNNNGISRSPKIGMSESCDTGYIAWIDNTLDRSNRILLKKIK